MIIGGISDGLESSGFSSGTSLGLALALNGLIILGGSFFYFLTSLYLESDREFIRVSCENPDQKVVIQDPLKQEDEERVKLINRVSEQQDIVTVLPQDEYSGEE